MRPQGSLGLSLERGPVRIDARWMVAGLTPEQAQLAIGWTWGRPPEPQPVPLVEAPVVQAPAVEAPVLDVSPADALVWVPHPYCRWMTVAEASLMLGELPADLRLQILAGGYLPGEASPGGELSVALDKAPEQASLVVAAQRGDEVRIGEATVPSANGAVVATVPLRDLTVTVIGGGRTEIHELSPADGYVLWVRTDGAAPLRVQFPVNSSTLQPAQRAEIAAIAAAAGHWSFQVQGGASPEGDAERNRKLADARGQAVAAALIEAGLDPERVEYLPSIAPTSSDQAFEVLRFATVTPIAPESP